MRLAHWSLAALVLFNFFNDDGAWHRYAGYAAAAIVGLRLLYGILVDRHGPARLHCPRPADGWAHLREMLGGRVRSTAGHNPLGSAMALLMWLLVLLLVLSGWMGRWDRFWGEEWLETTHHYLALALQVCVVLHLLGVAVSSLLERQNLVRGMITGKKRVDPTAPPRS